VIRPLGKRWFITGVAVLLTVVIGIGLLWPRPHRINQAGFDRITEGMTQREVEEVLGRPPGDYTDRRDPSYVLNWHKGASHRLEEWLSDDGLGLAGFDEDGRVVEKDFFSADNWPERPWKERVRRALPVPFRQGGGVADLGP
jgi:hypothetical protein